MTRSSAAVVYASTIMACVGCCRPGGEGHMKIYWWGTIRKEQKGGGEGGGGVGTSSPRRGGGESRDELNSRGGGEFLGVDQNKNNGSLPRHIPTLDMYIRDQMSAPEQWAW